MKKSMQSLKSFNRLKASSVMESVIAITIISACALVAFTIYLNVIKQNKSIHYFNAKHKVNLLIEACIKEQDYEDNLYQFKGYTIDKRVSINTSDRTALLEFSLNTGNKVNVINKLISYHEE